MKKRNLALCLALCVAIGVSYLVIKKTYYQSIKWTEEEFRIIPDDKLYIIDDPTINIYRKCEEPIYYIEILQDDNGNMIGVEIPKNIVESIETDWHRYVLKIKLKKPIDVGWR